MSQGYIKVEHTPIRCHGCNSLLNGDVYILTEKSEKGVVGDRLCETCIQSSDTTAKGGEV